MLTGPSKWHGLSSVALTILLVMLACKPARDSADVDRAVAFFHQRFTAGQDNVIYAESSPVFQRSTPLTSTRTGYRIIYNSGGTFVDVMYSTKFTNGLATALWHRETFSVQYKQRGYLLAQVDTTCSIADYGGIPAQPAGIRRAFCDRAGLPRLRVPAALDRWISMPALFRRSVLADEVCAVRVQRMWPPDLGDSGDNLPGHP